MMTWKHHQTWRLATMILAALGTERRGELLRVDKRWVYASTLAHA